MVSEYSQAYSSYPGGWDSFRGSQGAFSRSSYKGDNPCADSCNHLYEQWGISEAKEPKLRWSSEIRREVGGPMLTISGLKNFYYIPDVTDMRCGYCRLLQIVKQMTHHDPYNGDVFVFMSKDRRKVKMVHFENHAYYIHEKVFTNGYSFMLLEYKDENGVKSYRMDWKDLVAVLESPVIKKLKLR